MVISDSIKRAVQDFSINTEEGLIEAILRLHDRANYSEGLYEGMKEGLALISGTAPYDPKKES